MYSFGIDNEGMSWLSGFAGFMESSKGKPLMVLDEPERGLSVSKQILLMRCIREHAKKTPGLQIIIITHAPIFMRLAKELYSTTHRKYMTQEDYMKYMCEVTE